MTAYKCQVRELLRWASDNREQCTEALWASLDGAVEALGDDPEPEEVFTVLAMALVVIGLASGMETRAGLAMVATLWDQTAPDFHTLAAQDRLRDWERN